MPAIMLHKLIKCFLHARDCIYFEAYSIERRSGGESYIIPAGLVAVLDSPMIFFVVVLLDGLIFQRSIIREYFPTGTSSIQSVLYAAFVFAVELVWYRVGSRDRRIVDRFSSVTTQELSEVKHVALSYAAVSMIGGIVLVSLIW